MHVLLALLVAAALSQPGAPPAGTPMFDADGLRGWTAGRMTPDCVRNTSGTVSIAECASWLRTETVIAGDFTIAFDVRARDAASHGWLRLLGTDAANGRPEMNFALKIGGEWQSYVVTRNREGIHGLLNGQQILASGPVDAPDGWIGFLAQGTGLELRDVRLRHLPQPSQSTGTETGLGSGSVGGEVYRPGNGVVLPRVVREVRPNYTSDAMRAKIDGVVVLELVVLPDGTPDRIKVVRSLDQQFGLDNEAVKAASGWRFTPGTRNGVPVPVLITIEMTFTLGKPRD